MCSYLGEKEKRVIKRKSDRNEKLDIGIIIGPKSNPIGLVPDPILLD